MNRFFLVTFQWPVNNGFSTQTIDGGINVDSDTDAYDQILSVARNAGVPTNANVICFYLESAR